MVSDSNKILTFQGHPEMTKESHQAILNSLSSTLAPPRSDADIARMMNELAQPHDGERIFLRTMEWVLQE